MSSPQYNKLERGDSLYNENVGEEDVLEMTRIPSQGALRYKYRIVGLHLLQKRFFKRVFIILAECCSCPLTANS